MSKAECFERIELLKPYADKSLYSQMFQTKWMPAVAAVQAFNNIEDRMLLKFNKLFPDEITADTVKESDELLKTENINISDLIRDGFQMELKNYEAFLAKKDTKEFKEAYAAYLDDPDAVID